MNEIACCCQENPKTLKEDIGMGGKTVVNELLKFRIVFSLILDLLYDLFFGITFKLLSTSN